MVAHQQIQVRAETQDRIALYAGFLDIATGDLPWDQIEQDLKFSALFYPYLVVPDSFVHCNGPLLTHLCKLVNSSQARREADALLVLLREGILVPAIREGDSIQSNWINSRAGVLPGEMMVAPRSADLSNSAALKLVDDCSRNFLPWPRALAPEKGRQSRFASAVRSAFLASGSPFDLDPSKLPIPSAHQLDQPPQVASRLLDEFTKTLSDANGNPSFRRGALEATVGRTLGIPLRSYSELQRKVNMSEPTRTLAASCGLRLLMATSTAYELMQASELNCIAGLFPWHTDELLLLDIGSSLADLPAAQAGSNKNIVVSPNSLNLQHVSVFEVVNFRKTAKGKNGDLLFDTYQRHLEAVQPATDTESFRVRNPLLVDFLTNEYVPQFLKSYPNCSVMPTPTAATGSLVLSGSTLIRNTFESVSVGSIPLYSVLSALGALMIAPYASQRGVHWAREKALTFLFNKNNVALWNRKAQAATASAA